MWAVIQSGIEFGAAFLRHAWTVLAVLVIEFIGLGVAVYKDFEIPPWVWFVIFGCTFLAAAFAAFHSVRLDRDGARSELAQAHDRNHRRLALARAKLTEAARQARALRTADAEHVWSPWQSIHRIRQGLAQVISEATLMSVAESAPEDFSWRNVQDGEPVQGYGALEEANGILNHFADAFDRLSVGLREDDLNPDFRFGD
ncbi:MAG: hypothetical protein ACKVU4_00365 [Phycisphaerales bacterium]